MFKGFLRLAIVLSVVAWVPMSISLIKPANINLDLLINPHLGLPLSDIEGPMDDRWCVVAASSAFLEKSESERLALADSFFRENIEPVISETFIDAEAFRERFLWTATASLNEAPVKTWPSGRGRKYRDFTDLAWHGGPVLWKVAATGLIASAIVGIVLSALVTGIIAVVRWVIEGFTT
jgi:hypothetical protein